MDTYPAWVKELNCGSCGKKRIHSFDWACWTLNKTSLNDIRSGMDEYAMLEYLFQCKFWSSMKVLYVIFSNMKS